VARTSTRTGSYAARGDPDALDVVWAPAGELPGDSFAWSHRNDLTLELLERQRGLEADLAIVYTIVGSVVHVLVVVVIAVVLREGGPDSPTTVGRHRDRTTAARPQEGAG
jgi:hypothetical protein